MDLAGRNVVVTGGSQGIGEQMAAQFAAVGCRVLVAARSAARLSAVAKRIGGEFIVADLTDPADVDGLVDRCLDVLGSIDVWVNNAGVETTDAFVRVDRSDIRQLSRLNFEAPLLLTRDVLPHMLGRREGHVVQMSSVVATVPFPALAAYAGSKAGLTHFTETLRIELAGSGVGLTVVAPGPVEGEMWDRIEGADNYARPALDRFRRLLFLPKLDEQKVARRVVRAVEKGKPHVRLPARFAIYHGLNNAPRRMVRAALVGVKLDDLSETDTSG